LRLEMLAAERARVLTARDEGGYDDEVIRRVIRSLDVEEAMLETTPGDAQQLERDLMTPEAIAGHCAHLEAAQDLPVPKEPVCPNCVEMGTPWVHLRMCLSCGNVGCCDSSEQKHATAHFREQSHPVMRSVELGEAWRWCFVDEIVA